MQGNKRKKFHLHFSCPIIALLLLYVVGVTGACDSRAFFAIHRLRRNVLKESDCRANNNIDDWLTTDGTRLYPTVVRRATTTDTRRTPRLGRQDAPSAESRTRNASKFLSTLCRTRLRISLSRDHVNSGVGYLGNICPYAGVAELDLSSSKTANWFCNKFSRRRCEQAFRQRCDHVLKYILRKYIYTS